MGAKISGVHAHVEVARPGTVFVDIHTNAQRLLLAEPSRESSKEIPRDTRSPMSRSDVEVLKLALTLEAFRQMAGNIPDDGSIDDRDKPSTREQRLSGVMLAAEVCGHPRICWTG